MWIYQYIKLLWWFIANKKGFDVVVWFQNSEIVKTKYVGDNWKQQQKPTQNHIQTNSANLSYTWLKKTHLQLSLQNLENWQL